MNLRWQFWPIAHLGVELSYHVLCTQTIAMSRCSTEMLGEAHEKPHSVYLAFSLLTMLASAIALHRSARDSLIQSSPVSSVGTLDSRCTSPPAWLHTEQAFEGCAIYVTQRRRQSRTARASGRIENDRRLPYLGTIAPPPSSPPAHPWPRHFTSSTRSGLQLSRLFLMRALALQTLPYLWAPKSISVDGDPRGLADPRSRVRQAPLAANFGLSRVTMDDAPRSVLVTHLQLNLTSNQ
ncbi:predicted protein [Plenodomus lingam JN3]|uniref:Predicted protein n=1 Tax=Leptosphaeria maculans (strain JN3 / isolate v23.1.3 / race Av1-4-5-6-7-8) TaxID=985895 RepID=E5ADY1_LEPMJ|nr:predicted protein [Plenodomus lingam JN3]CBY01420.1 predicted protein [Plenodomus lingam JN3]